MQEIPQFVRQRRAKLNPFSGARLRESKLRRVQKITAQCGHGHSLFLRVFSSAFPGVTCGLCR
jgi:hypothetical protein